MNIKKLLVDFVTVFAVILIASSPGFAWILLWASNSTGWETAALRKLLAQSDNKKPDPPEGDPAAAIRHDESKKTSVLQSMVIHQEPKNGLQSPELLHQAYLTQ